MGHSETLKDFEGLSFHDNHIYAFRFHVGDPQEGTWHSELVLDIDHIVEWMCSTVLGESRFAVAPATLTFHHVTDLKLDVEWPETHCQINISEPSIHEIEREPLENQTICLDRAYFRWRIALNHPSDGAISFGASGLSLDLRAQPVLIPEQKLSPRQRGGEWVMDESVDR